jgi:RimJ/RimL family protein N-acetyltransferase
MRPSFAELIDIQRSALFIQDANHKLRYIREPGFDESELPPAPRFFMSRTMGKNIWSFRHDLPPEITQALQQLCLKEPTATDFTAPFLHVDDIRGLLNGHKPISHEERGPAYWIPEQSDLSENSTLITEANSTLLEPHFPWKITSRANFKTSALVASIVNDEAVSICYCARITEFAAEAGLETAEMFRGRGYAGQAVARWAEAVRKSELIPLYSTSWENAASQRVADKLQLINYGENWSVF